MKTIFKVLWSMLLAIILLVVLVWIFFGGSYLNILHYKIFTPLKEEVRRTTFENTQSYVEGKRQDLSNYYLQYKRAETDKEKKAIEFVVRQQFANFNQDILNDDMKTFLQNLLK